ncbi:aldehyde dehydrogenase family protein [Sporichthya sp.]|uniref:aldehyde dehydrogenase family protein n=1 Tax=Sporichthya sp. TaxID=65475 RepID=UPI0017BBC9B9|nr:aldehyde dehydrogenase family protein [Sporichthya sp.]MBA3743700.1 aldehyde dehydrogenase family protein [Sporichthya sp.]
MSSVPVVNPSTGARITDVELASLEQLDAAVAAARAAAPAWGADAAARAKALETVAAVITENADELARLLSTEIGVPLKDTAMEVGGAAAFAKYRARTPLAVDVVHDDERQSVVVRRKPIGVVGAILPWNAPLLILAEKVASAFGAGNTVVVKTSPLAPLAVARVGELLADQLPPGVLSILCGDAALGAALVEHPGVGMISFTGSIRAGRQIMAAAAPRLKRLSLELGGNDAALILPDVDVARTAPKVFMNAFYRTGQICAGIKRVYVPAQIYDETVEAFAHLASTIRVGDPFEEGVVLGPLSNRMQFDRVAELVDGARAAGATIVAGGQRLGDAGCFYSPTIVTDAGPEVPIVADEQFGPALPLIRYENLDEAITAANATDFGLGASVWGADPLAAAEIATRLDAGSVWVNRHGVVAPDVPFGGTKQSGVGRANGDVGVDAYSELTTISVQLNRAKPSA